jgi:hypothetical protein
MEFQLCRQLRQGSSKLEARLGYIAQSQKQTENKKELGTDGKRQSPPALIEL